MVAFRLSKGVEGMGKSTREHELGIQVKFLVVYIFKGNKQGTNSESYMISNTRTNSKASRRFCEKLWSYDAYKGSPD